MSTPTMNHNTHMQQHEQKQQQQQQQINEIQLAHSNSANSPHATLIRSDSTSTVILEEEETLTCRRNGPTTYPPSLLATVSARLHSLLKTSGLFNTDLESSDKLNAFFASDNGFALQRLLSEVNANDANLELNELLKFDSTKLLESRTLSEFLRSESFDQLLALSANTTDVLANPPAIPCSTSSFCELRSVSPELTTNNMFRTQSNQLKMERQNPLIYNQMDSFDLSTPTTVPPQFNFNQGALNAIEHDHAFLTKRNPVTDAPSTSTISKRTHTRGSCRASSRLQSRAVRSTLSENTSTKNKRARNANRAVDIKTSDDLSHYLERRRKNNEASKMSRAARRQKFGDMDQKCEEYERVNAELHMKIATLEKVTSTLKSGLVNNFQRKNNV